MSLELRELYQEVILDHNRRPRNRRHLEEPTGEADGYNALCGDQVKVMLVIEEGVVKDISFEGKGCAISTASASLMTEMVKGQTLDTVQSILKAFQALVTDGPKPDAELDLGELEALGGVKDYPVRIKCATLPWHTLQAALASEGTATTE